MFNHMIVGVDGLDGGADALALARLLASDETTITLVHAYPSSASSPAYDAALRDDAAALLAQAAPTDRPVAQLAIGDESPARALHETAERDHADAIVIGSCHHSRLGRVFLGDVSRGTLLGAPCPVVVAPQGFHMHAHAVKTIGVGFNDTPESRAALDLAAELANSAGAELHVLCAAHAPLPTAPISGAGYDRSSEGEQHRLRMQQALDEAITSLDVAATGDIVDDGAASALEQLSERVDMLVAGSRGWGAARRVVLGSTTDHLAHHASCPVVVVPAPAEAPDEAQPSNDGGRRMRAGSV